MWPGGSRALPTGRQTVPFNTLTPFSSLKSCTGSSSPPAPSPWRRALPGSQGGVAGPGAGVSPSSSPQGGSSSRAAAPSRGPREAAPAAGDTASDPRLGTAPSLPGRRPQAPGAALGAPRLTWQQQTAQAGSGCRDTSGERSGHRPAGQEGSCGRNHPRRRGRWRRGSSLRWPGATSRVEERTAAAPVFRVLPLESLASLEGESQNHELSPPPPYMCPPPETRWCSAVWSPHSKGEGRSESRACPCKATAGVSCSRPWAGPCPLAPPLPRPAAARGSPRAARLCWSAAPGFPLPVRLRGSVRPAFPDRGARPVLSCL